MRTKSTRVAKRREQRQARREERLRQQALLDSLGSTEWVDEELEGTPTDQTVETLSRLGIQTDEGSFRELALSHGSVDGVAEAWLAQGTTPGIWEDYPWVAARALWPRWTPDLFSVDVFIEQHLGPLGFDDEDPETLEDALDAKPAEWPDFEDKEPVLSQAEVGSPVASPSPARQNITKMGRNEPCPCGSGKKFKRCCARQDSLTH